MLNAIFVVLHAVEGFYIWGPAGKKAFFFYYTIFFYKNQIETFEAGGPSPTVPEADRCAG
jgi:hypothetical protein